MNGALQEPEKKWYKKKRYIIPITIFGLVGLASSFDNSTSNSVKSYAPATSQEVRTVPSSVPQKIQTQQPVLVVPSAQEDTSPAPVKEVPLSNNNTYINSRGNEVHSPAFAPSVPAGASAICGDGTYSFSQSRRGTCSHHGGVAEWL